ncbi:MAG TPA: hypothetical protein VIG97_14660 [Luteimonas sp.]
MSAGEKKPAKVRRVLVAKVIGFKAGQRKEWKAPRVDDLLRVVAANAPTLADRHYPPEAAIVPGKQCAFINRATDYGTGGVLIEVCSYVKGHIPESMVPDLSKASADISAIELKDAEGRAGELVHVFRAIFLGQTLVLEQSRGLGSASTVLASLLTSLVRRHAGDKTHPSFVFVDLLADDLRQMIRDRGGVDRVTAKLVGPHEDPSEGSRYASILSGTRAGMKDASACVVTWEAAGTLDEDEAIEVLEEADGEVLDHATLHFKNGGSISDLTTYRERGEVYVDKIDGRPDVTQIEKGMRDYLDRLRISQSVTSIEVDGTVTRIKAIGKKK